MRTRSLKIIMANGIHPCNIAVADKLAIFVVMTGRERHDLIGKSDKVFRFAGKQNHALAVITVV